MLTNHKAWSVGNYCFFNVKPFHDLVLVSLGSIGTINHVVNDIGATANTANQISYQVSFP
jgi:hypothetical protein